MKSKTLKATLAFLTASAAVVGFTGPTSAASVEGQTYSYPIATNGGSDTDITGNANATVDGTNVDVVAFADNIDAAVESVFMHFHAGATCDASGSALIPTDGTFTADVIDGQFVVEKTIPLGGADMDNVYFNVHNAAGGAVLGCGELDFEEGTDPAVDPPETITFFANSVELNTSGVAVSGNMSVQGNKLNVNLDYLGANLFDTAPDKHLLVLRSSQACATGDFDTLATDIVRSVTRIGSTAPPSTGYPFTEVWANSPWTATAGTPDALNIQTSVILTDDQAANIGSYSLLLLGSESSSDTSRPASRGGLTVRETIPANCAQFTGDITTPAAPAKFYNLNFTAYNGSGVEGQAFFSNNANGAAGSLSMVFNLPATNGTTYKIRLSDPISDTCSGVVADQPLLNGDNSELTTDPAGPIVGANGVIRGGVTNGAEFTGNERPAALNNGEYNVVITDNAAPATTILACAQMTPSREYGAAPATPAPPSAFDGTVAEATTLAEIQAASDYRANAANKGKDQEIMRLYRAFFNREPDVAGVQYWIAVSKGEAGPEANRRVFGTLELSGFFTGSNEFKTTFESVSSGDFVDTVYNNVLGRDGEPDGVAYWTDILNGTNTSGKNAELKKGSRAEVVYYVAINDEFVVRKPYSPPAA